MSDHNERLNESLSALMDGETTEMEVHRILKEVEQDQDLRNKWQRYHVASSIIGRESSVLQIDCSNAIAKAIATEPAYKTSRLAGLTGNVGRFAIAASVAMVAIFGVQQMNTSAVDDQLNNQLANTSTADEIAGPVNQFPSDFQPVIQARTVSAGANNKVSRHAMPLLEVNPAKDMQYSEAELRAYLNEMMLKHSSHAASNSNQGMLPFARLSKGDSQKAVK